ncbi:MAG: DUF6293 family protein [Euryarchaeota archaeon]|nr:DUF6293 family protein [Euryarchaeota archaeon]
MVRKKGTHIVAAGFEYDRVVKPMLEYPGDKLIVLSDKEKNYIESTELAEHFLKKLRVFPAETEEIHIDIYDFDNVFLKMLEIIKREMDAGRAVYVNISSAPKLTLVAMMSAVFFMRGKGEIEIIYCKPEKYLIPKIIEHSKVKGEFMEKGSGSGRMEYESLPVFPIVGVNDIDEKILKVLSEKKGAESIKKLVELMNGNIRRSSIQYRLEKLEEKGLVTKEREEKRAKLTLTKIGEIYLQGGTK